MEKRTRKDMQLVGELLAESNVVFVAYYDDKNQYIAEELRRFADTETEARKKRREGLEKKYADIGTDEALVFVDAPYLTDSDLFRESEFDAAFARIQGLIE